MVTSVLLLEIGEKSILIYNKRKNRGREKNGEKKRISNGSLSKLSTLGLNQVYYVS